MTHPDYNSALSLKAYMDSKGMAMQKKFGQNFLLNKNARERIASLLKLTKDDILWEVGPGLGCMTEVFLQEAGRVEVFEIDRGFIESLKEFLKEEEESGIFKLIEGDVLKNWQKEAELFQEGSSKDLNIKLAGNLPYNIAATFIAETIAKGYTFERCAFTVQKEVAERICAKASEKNYSAFSVLCQWAYNVKADMELAAGNFWPRPNVASQVVLLERRQEKLECADPQVFVQTVHALFSARRKTIANNIKQLLPGISAERISQVFDRAGIEKNNRAENLSVQDFLLLAKEVLSARMENQKDN